MDKSDEEYSKLLAVFLAKCNLHRLEELKVKFEGFQEYLSLLEMQRNLHAEIEKALPEKLKSKLSLYGGTWRDMLVLSSKFYYTRGFGDFNMLAQVSSSLAWEEFDKEP